MHGRSKIGSFSSGGQIEKLLKYCCSLIREFYESVNKMVDVDAQLLGIYLMPIAIHLFGFT